MKTQALAESRRREDHGRRPSIGTLSLACLAGLALIALLAAPAFSAGRSHRLKPALPTRLKPGLPTNTLDLSGDWKFKGDWAEDGLAQGWQKPDYDDSQWRTLRVPGTWEEQGIMTANPRWPSAQPEADDGYNGYAWYRRHFTVAADWAGAAPTLHVGAIDDLDWVYVNGQLIGATTVVGAWERPRDYAVPAELIKAGADNVIAVRVCDTGGAGGIATGPIELRRTTSAKGVPTGEYTKTRKEIVNIGGGAEVPATTLVQGDVVAIGGPVDVKGRVDGDVVAIGGPVYARPGSSIGGDAVAMGGEVIREGDASIGGSVVEGPVFPAALLKHLVPGLAAAEESRRPHWWSFRPAHFLVMLAVWSILTILAVVVLRKRLEVMADALPMHPGRAAGYGLVGFALTPAALGMMTVIAFIVSIVLIVTIVGILLVPAVAVALLAALLGVAALALLGTIAVWLSLGRAAAAQTGREGIGALPAALIGLLIVGFLSLIPVAGKLVVITALILGFGTAIMTGLGTRVEWSPLRRKPKLPEPPPPGPAAPTSAV